MTAESDARCPEHGQRCSGESCCCVDKHVAEPGAVIAAARAFVAAYEALEATDFATTRQSHIDTFDETLARLRAVLHPAGSHA